MRTVTTIRAATVLCALSLPGYALADVNSESTDTAAYQAQPSLYVGGFYMRPDAKRSTTRRSQGWSVGLGMPIWQGLSLEASAFTANLDTGTLNQSTLGNSDFYQRGGGLDAVWNFRRQDQFNPFVLAGLGAVYDDVLPKSDKKTSLYYDAGLGFTNPIFGNASATPVVYPAGRVVNVGLVVPSSLVAASVLGNVSISTTLNGVAQEATPPGLLSLQVLGLLGSGAGYATLPTTKPFDGVRVNFGGTVTALSPLQVHMACVSLQ